MLTLTESSQPRAAIILAADAPPTEQHAAGELQSHLAQISGATLPIAAAAQIGRPAIFLGRTGDTERLLAGLDWATLKDDGCVARVVGDRLVLAGATPRGTLYAVYEFLERELGCRWFTPKSSVIPKRATITLDALDIVHVPVFRYRELFFTCGYDADWLARNRVNGSFMTIGDDRGGQVRYAGFVHTFYDLLPPQKYFAAHPEYFSEVNGKRIGEGGQLCLTNTTVVELVTEAARQKLRDTPDARIISVSQNDWVGNCTCASCRALDDAEGSPSGSLIQFVNAVAANLEGEFPQVLVDTLAYMYTIDPPRTLRPRRNVVVRLCHLNAPCDSHPLEKCDMNRQYLQQLQGWGKISPEVFIWDYFNNFANYFLPYPNLDAIVADIPLYARSGVTGLFCQGDGTPPKGPGDMAELRAYLLAKLLWRPDADGRAVIEEFLNHYYGVAAEPIRQYLEMLHRPAREGPVHIAPYMQLSACAGFLPEETLARAEALLAEAARLAGEDEELARRIAAAKLPLDFVRMKQDLRFVRRGKKYTAKDPKSLEQARRFHFDAIAQGAAGLRESSGRPIREELMELDPADLVMIELDGLRVFVAPRLGGRIISLLDPVTGHDWMFAAQPDSPAYPVAGGYEEYSQVRWHSPGWNEPYVADATKESVMLSAALSEGLVLQRLLKLERGDAGPRLVFESTLRNGSYEVRNGLLRLHPDLNAGNLKQAALLIGKADGSWEEWAPWRTGKEKDGHRWLEGDAVPAGRWALRSGARQLEISFEPGQVHKCLPSWSRAFKSVCLDMYGHPVRLQPRQSTTIRHVWTPGQAVV